MEHPVSGIWIWMALTLSLSSAYDIIPGRPIDHTKSICSSWGNFHYKTFDGVIYQFPGTCNYNLASHCDTSYHEFSVHIERSFENGSPLIHQILIQIKDVTIELKRDAEKVNGAIFETPYFNYGVFINKKDGYTKVNTKIGLTLTWNQEDSVMLEVDSRYQNKLCGLCGDYNGMPVTNEFYINDMPLNPIQFGNMQTINDPTMTCTNVDESQQMNVSSCGQYYSVCKSYLSQRAFSSCHELLDVSDYIMACMLDVCSCSSGNVSCLCRTLTEYSRQCTHAGGGPKNWRTNELCPKQCSGNMIYKESGSPCISSCSHREVKSLCEEHDVDGCFCPDGTVWDDYNNTGCISGSKCQCKYQDQLYTPGSKILNDCEECTCNAGKWTCTHGICPKVCSIEGGAHFKTFDGKPYKFHGNCYYLLSKIDLKNGEAHTIAAELTPCNAYSRETCLKTIQFYTDDNKNVLSIRADGSVLLNDLKISLPQVTGSFSVIQPTESNIFVKTKFGLQMQIYLLPLMQLYISMDNSDKNTFEGLCGNFNYIEGDDFKTSAGIEESIASAFANTWKIQSTCQDSSEMLIDPCSFSIETKIYAEKWCSMLKKSESPFWKCHFAVDPEEYYKRCEYDTCSCSHSETCMCASLSSYARACAAKGIVLWDWKKGICDKEIPSCPSSQIYLYNITTCQSTCRSLSRGEKECDSEFTPIDGCGCPDGMYVNEKDVCVPISQCSCYYQGMYLRPNEVFFKTVIAMKENLTAILLPMTVGAGCISGCVCPDGLLDDGNGGCVHESACPCSYNSQVFHHGSRLIEECKSCTCESGLWSCIQTPCYGSCAIYGSGHYITFDKKFYDFDGSCEFVVAQDYCGDSASNGTFRIITENIPCGTTGVTCSKSIKIYLGNTELKLTNSHMEKKFGESETEVKYRVREVGLYLIIHTSSDLSLIWDKKTSLLIRLPSSYKGKVCGLCGNYDDNANNDFLTSQLIQASNVMPFGNSWKRSNECPDADSLPQPCLAAPHRRSWAEKKCDIITNNVFQSCHSKVDPKPFYDACVNDVCSCDTGGDCECFCTAVAAYAQLCAKADVCVHWRTPEICPIFCDYYNTDESECMWHYFACGPDNNHNHHVTKFCRSPTVTHLEGCYPACPFERPYYDEINKRCTKHCPCIINNVTYSSGERIDNADPCKICSSYRKGTLFIDFIFSFSICNEHGEEYCSKNSDCCSITTGTSTITYPPNTTISTHTSKELCATRKCTNGRIIQTTTLCSIPTTTTAKTTHKTTHSTTCFCHRGRNRYRPGQRISSESSESDGLCWNIDCADNCQTTTTKGPCESTSSKTTKTTTREIHISMKLS
ncbi:mucin-2 [Xenopus laevis]|uniref:von Willebrand factor n=1 Tax=Xenopus laevis TaxID=8355 RepID=A0A8J1MW36_XENLA|nr:mucin-2 [Xenopus laevis]